MKKANSIVSIMLYEYTTAHATADTVVAGSQYAVCYVNMVPTAEACKNEHKDCRVVSGPCVFCF